MTYLDEALARAEKKYPPDSRFLQMLRDQVAAQKTGKSAKELYLTGSVEKLKESDQ